MRASLGLRMRITVALAATAAATALFAVLGAMWIISGIIDRADQRELRSHYDALQSRIAEESQRAAAMSAVVAAIPAFVSFRTSRTPRPCAWRASQPRVAAELDASSHSTNSAAPADCCLNEFKSSVKWAGKLL